MNLAKVEIPFGNQNLIIETGKYAKQANGAVTVTFGGTVVLVTACMAKKPRPDAGFFPLMVEYQEKTYSAGRIPGGFFKREGRPTQKEILTARVIDRPIRPLFPEGFFNEIQVVATVLSSDGENDPDVLALIGASTALSISDIPFAGPIGGVRVALVEDEFVLSPTYEQREQSELEFILAGQADGIVMIEGEAQEVSEENVLKGLEAGSKVLPALCQAQLDLQKQLKTTKADVEIKKPNEKLLSKVKEMTQDRIAAAYQAGDKQEREKMMQDLVEDTVKDMSVFDDCKIDDEDLSKEEVIKLFDLLEYEEVRRMVFDQSKRADGRGLTDVRPISCEVNVLPRTHGAGLFTRGQTQSLAVVTLGSKRDEQLVESLEGTSYNNFMLHYNFPSFSVGETRPMRGPGRREIGHGALAAKALKAVLPSKDDFPYTIRIVSEILESNGSSSMASVCAGALALMDAGVPIKEAVAGISVGLVTKDDQAVLITDIMGLEDHFGDMDFKVAGTQKGITAIQLDLKIKQVSLDLLAKAMVQAKDARNFILGKMKEAIAAPREELSDYAPRILSCMIPPEKIGEVIGPGGKCIKKIIEDTGVEAIDIDDDGKVLVASVDKNAAEQAIAIVKSMVQEPEIGKTYDAVVKRVMNFGAFCEFMPGKEGLVHVSEFSTEYVKDCNDVAKVDDKFRVKLVEKDKMGRFNLSKKQAE